MPTYLTDFAIWKAVWPILAFALLIGAVISLMLTRQRPLLQIVMLSMTGMALLGLTIGQITGFSRDPAVAAVLPAVLTLVGGVAVFLVSSGSQNSQVLASASIIALSLGLLLGTFWGARLRQDHYQAHVADVARDEAAVRLTREIMEEVLRRKRLELGLPEPVEEASDRPEPEP